MPQRMKDAVLRYGFEFYGQHFGLDRVDKTARRACYRANYELWGAPVVLILTCPTNSAEGTFLDMGSFMTSVLLGAHAYGLGAKPQFSVAKVSCATPPRPYFRILKASPDRPHGCTRTVP